MKKSNLINKIMNVYFGSYDEFSHIISSQKKELSSLSTDELSIILSTYQSAANNCNPTIIKAINNLKKRAKIILCIKEADEVGAYEMTEHLGNNNFIEK